MRRYHFETHHTNEQAYEEVIAYTHKEREALLTLSKYKPHLLGKYAKEVLRKYKVYMERRMLQMKIITARKRNSAI